MAYFLVDRVKMDVDEDGEPRKSLWRSHLHAHDQDLALRGRATKLGVLGISTALFVATSHSSRASRPSSSTLARRRS